MHTADDVGPAVVNGVEMVLPLEERQKISDEWNANEQAAADAAHAGELAAKHAQALRALQDKVLADALADPNAPQAVKDYATLLRSIGV